MVYRKEMNQRLVLASNSGLHFQSYKLSQFPDSLAVERSSGVHFTFLRPSNSAIELCFPLPVNMHNIGRQYWKYNLLWHS